MRKLNTLREEIYRLSKILAGLNLLIMTLDALVILFALSAFIAIHGNYIEFKIASVLILILYGGYRFVADLFKSSRDVEKRVFDIIEYRVDRRNKK